MNIPSPVSLVLISGVDFLSTGFDLSCTCDISLTCEPSTASSAVFLRGADFSVSAFFSGFRPIISGFLAFIGNGFLGGRVGFCGATGFFAGAGWAISGV